jgi:hypothetical protein
MAGAGITAGVDITADTAGTHILAGTAGKAGRADADDGSTLVDRELLDLSLIAALDEFADLRSRRLRRELR